MARRRYLLQPCSTNLDWLGHVNNVAFGEYLQEARVDVLTQWRDGLTHPELSMMAAKQEIEYRRPLHFRSEPVAIDSWIARVGTTSFTFVQEIREPDGDVLYAGDRCVVVQVDNASERPTALSDPRREHLLSYADEGSWTP